MKNRSFLHRSLVLLLILTMISGGTVLAENGAGSTELRMNFPDVPKGDWAQKHVSKLALLGITEGTTAGTFNRNGTVIQQDVIKMAVSLMGYTEDDINVQQSQPNHVIQFLNHYVDPYAHAYVALAFSNETGILDFQTELANVKNNQWGKQQATREWVTRVIIQAIDRTELAHELSNQATAFTDNNEISSWALGFVNAAVELKIVTGSTDGGFYPANTITRAELAALLSRAEHYLDERSDRVQTGILTALTSNQLSIQDANGQTITFNRHPDQQFYSVDVANDAIVSSRVRMHSKVYVIAQAGTAYYVEVTDPEPQLEAVEGVLIDLDLRNLNAQSITLQTEGDFKTFALSSGGVEVVDVDGSGSSLGRLINKSTVILTLDTIIGNEINLNSKVIKIAVKSIPVNKQSSGVIEALNSEDRQMSIRETASGSAEVYTVPEDVVITYGGRILPALTDLTIGDGIDYTIEDSVLTKIELTSTNSLFLETIEGTILEYSVNSNILTLEDSERELVTKRFAKQVEIVLPGMDHATIADLEKGDNIIAQYNALNEIVKIEILNREVLKLNQVEIYSDYDADINSLVVLINKELRPYKLNENTMIEYASQRGTLAEVEFDLESIFVKGKKVDMVFTNHELMEIKLSSYYDGIVKAYDPVQRTITIETEQGDQRYNLVFSAYVEIFNTPSANLSVLNIGDSVRLNLNASQTQINRIQLKQSVPFRVVSTNAATRRVTVKDQTGKESSFTLNSIIPLTHHAKSIPSFTDIVANDTLIISYIGNTIDAIEVPKSQRGTLQSINTATRQLSLLDHSGQGQSYSWTDAPVVYDAGTNKEIAVTALNVQDRLEIVVDSAGRLFITKLEKQERRYWKFEAGTLYFRDGTWTADYPADNVYLHQRGTVLTPASFTFLDHVDLYLLNGMLVEVEKK